MTDPTRMRDDALAECSYPERFELAAYEVAAALRQGDTIELAFAPGNGTRYAFLFVPIAATTKVTVGDYLESASVGEGGVWVARLNGDEVIYPVMLIGRDEAPAPPYIAEKWFGGRLTFDVFILERLLQLIGQKSRLVPSAQS